MKSLVKSIVLTATVSSFAVHGSEDIRETAPQAEPQPRMYFRTYTGRVVTAKINRDAPFSEIKCALFRRAAEIRGALPQGAQESKLKIVLKGRVLDEGESINAACRALNVILGNITMMHIVFTPSIESTQHARLAYCE